MLDKIGRFISNSVRNAWTNTIIYFNQCILINICLATLHYPPSFPLSLSDQHYRQCNSEHYFWPVVPRVQTGGLVVPKSRLAVPHIDLNLRENQILELNFLLMLLCSSRQLRTLEASVRCKVSADDNQSSSKELLAIWNHPCL